MKPTGGEIELDQGEKIFLLLALVALFLSARALISGINDFAALRSGTPVVTRLSLGERRLLAGAKVLESFALPLGLFSGFLGPGARGVQAVFLILGLGVFPAVILVLSATAFRRPS